MGRCKKDIDWKADDEWYRSFRIQGEANEKIPEF